MNPSRSSYPPGFFIRVARDVLLLRRRDFRRDATDCIKHLQPPLQVLGEGHVPAQGPCVITVNHYHRPGFSAEWLAFAISALVPRPVHWVMTGEFTYAGKWYASIGSRGSRILLKRIAQIYGFTTMPPMPPRPADVERRVRSVRAVLEYVRKTSAPVLGLAPEGYDPPSGALTSPPHGAGRFGLLLAGAGLRFIPVGAYEAEGCFYLRFGAGYELTVPDDLAADERDRRAARIMMGRISLLLPLHLRGEFA
jgi:hypothetical protein